MHYKDYSRTFTRVIYTFGILLIALSCTSDKRSKDNASALSQTIYKPTAEVQQSIKRGSEVYNNYCAQCHLGGGGGIANIFPPVNKADWLYEKRKESIHAIKYGLSGPIVVSGDSYDNLMPNLYLEDQEVADVMNYMLTAWDNQMSEPVTLEEVKAIEN